MAKFGDTGELLKCSFCGKSQKQVKKLIAGPGVYICDECIDLCNEIIEEELTDSEELRRSCRWRCTTTTGASSTSSRPASAAATTSSCRSRTS